MKVNVLLTGAGAPGAPGIIKCLKLASFINLTVCDANPNAVGRYLNEHFFTIPKASDPAFSEIILEECLKRKIDVVVPIVTRELFHFANQKIEFRKKGITVLVSDYHALHIANDKSKLYEFLASKNIEVPDFRVVNNIDSFKQALKDLGYPSKKVCFKPSVSNGSRGFRIIDDAVDEFDLLFNYKPNSTFIKYDDSIRILSSQKFPELLVSEFLPGDEYSIDCLAVNGKCKLAVPRIRRKMNNGISVEGEFINNREIVNYCENIIEAVGLDGNIGIQVKGSEEGKYLLLEINPRLQGTVVAALGANINLPLLAVKKALDMEISNNELEVKWGTKFSRFWEEVYY